MVLPVRSLAMPSGLPRRSARFTVRAHRVAPTLMGYVIAAIVVVLVIAGLLTVLVGNATRKSNVSDAGDPAGDTNQLSRDGEGGRQGADAAAVARPVVGGE